MKRAFRSRAVLVVASVVAVVAAGCGGSTVTPGTTYVIDTPAPGTGTPTASPTPAPGIAVISTVHVSDSGNTTLCHWTADYDKPVISGVPAADAMNAAIDTRINAFITHFRSQLGEGVGNGSDCTLEGHFIVGANTLDLISLGFTDSEYLGGASTTGSIGSLTFQLPAGTSVAFADIFTATDTAAAELSTNCRTLLLADPDNDPDWVNTGTQPILGNFEHSWLITSAGLQITFPELQVGPTAAGMPSVVVPWSAIHSVIRSDGPAGSFVAGL
jgi:hypothetical protein